MRQLESSVIAFYRDYQLNKETINIDADNAISILTYIIVQANQPHLSCHISLVQNFGNPVLKNGNGGYCLTTIEACL